LSWPRARRLRPEPGVLERLRSLPRSRSRLPDELPLRDLERPPREDSRDFGPGVSCPEPSATGGFWPSPERIMLGSKSGVIRGECWARSTRGICAEHLYTRYTSVCVVQKMCTCQRQLHSTANQLPSLRTARHASISLDHGSRARQAHARRQQAAAAIRGCGWLAQS
jgi:hypothetical protein